MNFIQFPCLIGLGILAGVLSIPAPSSPTSGADLEDLKPGSAAVVMPSVAERFSKETDEVPDFQRHVGPLLGRLGCNGRSCHGSFQGQGGLQLSLFGYDFDKDHQALVEDGTYRVDLEDPVESLILTKPTDADDHGGGLRFAESSWQYHLLENWIRGGAKDLKTGLRLEKLQVTPAEIQSQSEQVDQLKVIAQWSDGTHEDVTPLSRFQSNNPQVASVNETGKIVVGNRGDTHVIVFYDNEVISIPVLSTTGKATNLSTVPFANPTEIDKLVINKLNRLGIQPSEDIDDLAFLRRVSLDITGTLPTPDEIREFLAEDHPDKRKRKIEALLETDAYAAWWTTFLCDLTGNSSKQLNNVAYGDMAAKGWYQWIYQRVQGNVPYDEIVRGIVMSSSRNEEESLTEYSARMSADLQDGDASRFAECSNMPYYWMRRDFQDKDARAISFAHSFLGVKIQCAQCHKHPFDQWTQDDFTQFSRFFSGVTIRQPQRALPAEKEEFDAIYAKLEIDPTEVRGGNLRRQLAQKARQGNVVPFPELNVGPARKDREELKAEEAAMKQQMAEQQAMSQMDSSDEMMGEAPPKKKLTKAERRALQRKLQAQRKAQQRRMRFYTDAILLGGDGVQLNQLSDAREPAMQWLLHESNPYFAKAIVNRIWARYFGVGIVEPADDLNLANPPSNGPLLDYLADGFVANGYDLKWVHREIANSQIYQRSWETNETNAHDRRNFSHALPRRLPAEAVFDAVAIATAGDSKNKSPLESIQGRAIAIPGTPASGNRRKGSNSMAFAMKLFGRSTRESSCDCDRSDETSLVQSVFMQNDRHIHEQINRDGGWVGTLRKEMQGTPITPKQTKDLKQARDKLKQLQTAQKRAEKKNQIKEVQRLQRRMRQYRNRINQAERAIADAEKTREIEPNIDAWVTEAWLRTLSRFPTEEERQRCREYFADEEDPCNALGGVMWALLNTKEFIVNH